MKVLIVSHKHYNQYEFNSFVYGNMAHRYTSRRFLGALRRRPVLTGVVMAAALIYAADRASINVTSPLFFEQPPPITEFRDCASAFCQRIEREVIAATELWLKTQRDVLGVNPPSYLNVRLSIGAAGIESRMGAMPDTPGSNFKWLFQFNAVDKDTSIHFVMNDLIKSLNAAKDQIPALKGIRQLTPDIVLSDKILSDTTVQTFAMLEVAKKYLPKYAKHPNFSSLDEGQLYGLLYLAHNYPIMGDSVLDNLHCERAVIDLPLPDVHLHLYKTAAERKRALQRRGYKLRKNKEVYGNGQATPLEVFHRISSWKHPFLIGAKLRTQHPDLMTVTTKPYRPKRSTETSLIHAVVRKYVWNRLNCKS